MEQKRRPPHYLFVLFIYASALVLASLTVVGFGLRDSILYFFIVPCILCAFFYQRRVYLSMILMLAVIAVWVTSRVSGDFQASLTSIVIAVLSTGSMAEIVRHLTQSRQHAERALQESEEKFRNLSLLKNAILESPEGIISICSG